MPITEQEHLTTNLGFDVSIAHEEPNVHRVIAAHVDEHAREEMLEGLHPDHATNFGLILPTEITDDASRPSTARDHVDDGSLLDFASASSWPELPLSRSTEPRSRSARTSHSSRRSSDS